MTPSREIAQYYWKDAFVVGSRLNERMNESTVRLLQCLRTDSTSVACADPGALQHWHGKHVLAHRIQGNPTPQPVFLCTPKQGVGSC